MNRAFALSRPALTATSCLTWVIAMTAMAPSALAQSSTVSPAAPAGTPAATQPAAEKPTPAADNAAAPAAPANWSDTIKLSLQFDAGFTLNPQRPRDGLNWGQLFTDRANQLILNQAAVTVERKLDPKATGYDFGFKGQFLWGTDGRFVQPLGVFNHVTDNRYQPALVEANVVAHTPWLTEGGIDWKLGQFATPLGYETIDPSTNPFYSHSYIFNFGLPFTALGLLSVTHVNGMLDIYAGIDSGVNTTLGTGDNNHSPAGTGGLNLTFLDGRLTVLALSHFGPENSYRAAGSTGVYSWRYENDIVVTYKATDKLTFTSEGNFIRDDYFKANGGGFAQYVSYALNDQFTLNGRAEIWREDHGFYVVGVQNGRDYVQSEYGFPTAITRGPGTYSEFTAGATWKPAGLPAAVSTLLVRPELRVDQALTGFSPYGGGKARTQFTAATDVVLGF